MVGSFMSTFLSFFPQNTQWFCIAGLAIFFFGIYIPFDKYRQKRKKAGKWPPKLFKEKPPKKQTGWKQVEQLDHLKKAGVLTEEEYRERIRRL